MCVAGATTAEQIYHLACGYCRWSSRAFIEAAQPEQLISKFLALEREAEPRQRMSIMVEAYRARVQEQQRLREMQEHFGHVNRAGWGHGELAGWPPCLGRFLASGPV